jgi:hypothetical protein
MQALNLEEGNFITIQISQKTGNQMLVGPPLNLANNSNNDIYLVVSEFDHFPSRSGLITLRLPLCTDRCDFYFVMFSVKDVRFFKLRRHEEYSWFYMKNVLYCRILLYFRLYVLSFIYSTQVRCTFHLVNVISLAAIMILCFISFL